MFRDEYETELAGDRADVAAALSGVVDGLLAGSLRVGEAEAVTVDLPDELDLEIEFEAEGDERSLELELEWDGDADGADIEPAEAVEPLAVEEGLGVAVEPEESGEADVTTESGTAEEPQDGDEPTAQAGEVADSESAEPEEATDAEEPVVLPVGAADAPASLGRFELYRDRADEWRWRLRHRNGNVIATSGEGYTRKANARKGLRSVMRNAPGAVVQEE